MLLRVGRMPLESNLHAKVCRDGRNAYLFVPSPVARTLCKS